MTEYLNASEAVAVMERYFGQQFCLTYEVMVFARHAKEFHRVRQMVALWREKEKEMLTVTGTANFVAMGSAMELTVKIQPTTPEQHDLLERIASEYPPSSKDVYMEQGNLVVKGKFLVPSMIVAEPESSPETESAPQLTNTSAKTEGDDLATQTQGADQGPAVGGISGAAQGDSADTQKPEELAGDEKKADVIN
jgi:hypothetical protein